MIPATYLTIPCPIDFINYLNVSGYRLERQDQTTGDLYYRNGGVSIRIGLDVMIINCGAQEFSMSVMHKSFADILNELHFNAFTKALFYQPGKAKTMKACFNNQNIRA